MMCDATGHSMRVGKPVIAVQLMRIDNPCRKEAKVVALCETCYRIDLNRIESHHYRCTFCGKVHEFSKIWKMIGRA